MPGRRRSANRDTSERRARTSRTATGIGLHTSADVHYGLAADTDQRRRDTLAAPRAATPNRFTSNTDPKVLDLPEAAWINPPITQPEHQEQEIVAAAA